MHDIFIIILLFAAVFIRLSNIFELFFSNIYMMLLLLITIALFIGIKIKRYNTKTRFSLSKSYYISLFLLCLFFLWPNKLLAIIALICTSFVCILDIASFFDENNHTKEIVRLEKEYRENLEHQIQEDKALTKEYKEEFEKYNQLVSERNKQKALEKKQMDIKRHKNAIKNNVSFPMDDETLSDSGLIRCFDSFLELKNSNGNDLLLEERLFSRFINCVKYILSKHHDEIELGENNNVDEYIMNCLFNHDVTVGNTENTSVNAVINLFIKDVPETIRKFLVEYAEYKLKSNCQKDDSEICSMFDDALAEYYMRKNNKKNYYIREYIKRTHNYSDIKEYYFNHFNPYTSIVNEICNRIEKSEDEFYNQFSVRSLSMTMDCYQLLMNDLISLKNIKDAGYDTFIEPNEKMNKIKNDLYSISIKSVDVDTKEIESFIEESIHNSSNSSERYEAFVQYCRNNMEALNNYEVSKLVKNYTLNKINNLAKKFNYVTPYKLDESYVDNTLNIDAIDRMSGEEFEDACVELLKNSSFENIRKTQVTGDQGVDILAEKDQIRYAIQCKCYSQDLGNTPVQEVGTGRQYYDCHVAAVMTNRYFTDGAKELAKKNNVLLWDRDYIISLMAKTSTKNNEV